MTKQRWLQLMTTVGFDANEDTFHSLRAAYAEKHRHYHTGEHLRACLEHLDRCADQAQRPEEIELALWFHDAIYRPLSADNEKKSADWAASFLQENGAPPDRVERVRRLILATEHHAEPETGDAGLLVDIDLAILGADAAEYDEYERAVRKEYRLVPAFLYRKKRAGVLGGFLERRRIYQNEPFYSEREEQARANLSNAISRLAGGDGR